jgi:uncharacterized protein
MSDEIDLESLDTYLSSDDSPDDCMMLSDLDGFLHGVVCSAVPIPQDEWLSAAMGERATKLPTHILEIIIDLHDTILDGLTLPEPEVEPIFWEANAGHVIAMDWCEGFMDAVALRPKEWLRLTESGSDGGLVTPIMVHMMDDNGQSVMGIPHEQLQQVLGEAADAIPETVTGIFQFWRSVGQLTA